MRRRNFLWAMSFGCLASLAQRNQRGLSEENTKKAVTLGSMDPWIEVDLDHIAWNVAQIEKQVRVPLMAVVKANAYGHGLVEVARFLEKRGVRWLMVGKLEEAVKLRRMGVECSVLNFGAFSREDCEEIVSGNVSQVVYSGEAIYLEEMASKLSKRAAVHIHVDTGMGRVGIPYLKALPFIEKVSSSSHLKVEGVSTTLTEDKEFDQEQLRRFEEVCSSAEKKGIALGLRHAASSAGILAGPQYHLDMVRPGISLYGYYPSPQTQKEDKLALKPALKLKARVILTKDLFPQESLSYHRVFVAEKKMRVATLGIGYSDGYPSQLANKAAVSIRNKNFPLIAAVTANHSMVDLENNQEIGPGDEVILIDDKKNSGLTADILSEWSGFSVYKILIGLNPLLPRKYTET